MSEKSHRRWFRFSLRTLFLMVTVMCCWLGWESNVVRQRRALLNDLGKKPAYQFTSAKEWETLFPTGGGPTPFVVPGSPPARVPLVRGWLGDEAIQEIWYSPEDSGFSKSDLGRLAKTFPEAKVSERPPRQMEPCHPGCFPRGTLVDTPDGLCPIEEIGPGEYVTIVLAGRKTSNAMVQSVFVTQNRLWSVETETGILLTTETQPLCLSDETIRAAGKLEPGDQILRLEGKELQVAEVLSVSRTKRVEKVFNLVLGNCEVFIAGGYLARSKPPPEIAAR